MLRKAKCITVGLIMSCMFISQSAMWNVHAASKDTTSAEENVNVGIIADHQRSVNFNKNWKFLKGDPKDGAKPEFNDAGWRSLDLPHDYSIEGDFTTKGEAESGFLLGGVGWYRKHIAVPQKYEGKSIILNFDGVYMNADVYVNGKKLGSHPYGYTSFSFDISPYLTYDGVSDNVIAVRVNNAVPSSRWYSGSGIYRDVKLIVTDKIHVEQDGQYITTPNLEKEQNGDVNVATKTTIRNDTDQDSGVVVKQSVLDAKGKEVSTPVQKDVTIKKQDRSEVEMNLAVHKPALWSTQHPNMYQVKTEVLKDGKVLDTYVSDFGFRYFTFDRATGFSLNGQKTKLKGVSMHHDQGALGAVANERAVERQVQKLKAMGANAIRVTHNPASTVLLDVANREGMLIIDEAFDGWAKPKNGNVNDFSAHFNEKIGADNKIIHGSADMTWAEFEAKTMVRHAKNNPSVIMWSIGNEITSGSGDDGHYPEYAKNIISWIQSIDKTRPVTMGDDGTKGGNALYRQISQIIAENGGVVGLNYASNQQYKSIYDNNPDWTLYGSETSSAIRSRGIYNTKGQDKNTMQLSSYDSIAVGWGELANKSLKSVLSNDFVAGEFVWTGFDYIGEPTPYNGTGTGSVSGKGATPKSSYFGIIDTAGFEKDVYYLYQSQWNDKVTTLHVLPTWNEENLLKDAKGNVEVDIYSNAPEVELFLNDKSLGKQKMTKQTTAAGHSYYTDKDGNMFLKYNVPYTKGTLRAVAYDNNGNVIKDTSGRNSVTTSGEAAALSMKADRSEIQADGTDLSYISVDVNDKDGNPVTYANNRVNFSVAGDGKIVGVDNGDPTDTDSYKGTSRKAFSGKAMVIVQSTRKAGNFTVTASGDGMKSAQVHVTTKKDADASSVYLESYRIAKHHYVSVNEKPQLPSSVPVTFSNGDVSSYDVVWDAYDSSQLTKPHTFQVSGTLKGTDVKVFVDIHVLGNIVSVIQPSVFMNAKEPLSLPKTVQSVMEDGTLSEKFPVVWETVSPDKYAQEGQFTVNGTAQVMDKKMSVKADVRVGKALPTPVDIASSKYTDAPALSESTKTPTDNLASINNGIVDDSVNLNERWTNWNDRDLNEMAYITMNWKEQYTIDKVNLWLFTDNNAAALPKDVVFEYDDNGTWVNIPYTSTTPVGYLSGETTYLFDKPIEMKKLRIGMLEQPGKCIGLTEAKVYKYEKIEESNKTANLQSITLDGTPLNGFDSGKKDYTVSLKGEPVKFPAVEAQSKDHAGVTILPVYDNKTKILVLSEDGHTMNTYTIRYDLPVDIAKLQAIVDQSKEMLIQENKYVHDDHWKQFTQVAAKAEELLRKPTTQKDIDAVVSNLQDVMNKLSLVLMEGSEEQTLLQTYVAKAANVDKNMYSKENYAFIQKVKDDAAAVLYAKAYTRSQMDNLKNDITKANQVIDHDKLPVVVKVDKTALQTTIQTASAMNTKGYTTQSVKYLHDVLNQAKAVLNKKDATQSEVDKANALLKAAMNNLVKDPSYHGNPSIDKQNPDGVHGVNTGDTSMSGVVLLALVLLSGAGMMAIRFIKRKKAN